MNEPFRRLGKIGLALGGGAARGWAHIGVLRALERAGIRPDVIAGTSIGAVAGAFYASDLLDDLEAFARGLTRRRVFGYLDFNFAGSGLISGHRLGERMDEHLGDLRIEDLNQPFTAVATEIGSGHEVWLSRGRVSDCVRASYALPGIFRPVKIDQRWLFDGALVNPIPISACRAMGARYVIAVNLNMDIASRGTIASISNSVDYAAVDSDMPDKTFEAVMAEDDKKGVTVQRLLQRQLFGNGEDAPGISTVMVDAFNIVQDRIARSRLAGDPPDAMISPRLHNIGLFDFHKAEDMIRLGEIEADREIAEIHRCFTESEGAQGVAEEEPV